MYKKYDKENQRLMATWAADCAARVLPFFEKLYPYDDRPRKAIEECRAWVRTGKFKMAVIRGSSLAAHSAAREVKENLAACFAARAAGQAVATAHVPQHCFGSAYYSLKSVASTDPLHAAVNVVNEWAWELQNVPDNLREEALKRIIIINKNNKNTIKIIKDKDF